MLVDFLPIGIFIIIACGVAGALVFFSHLTGTKKPSSEKLSPYECGANPIGNARVRFQIGYFLIAILFIIFDFEGVSLYPWAVIFKQLGWFGLVEMGVFLAILFIGLIYVWRNGVFDWN